MTFTRYKRINTAEFRLKTIKPPCFLMAADMRGMQHCQYLPPRAEGRMCPNPSAKGGREQLSGLQQFTKESTNKIKKTLLEVHKGLKSSQAASRARAGKGEQEIRCRIDRVPLCRCQQSAGRCLSTKQVWLCTAVLWGWAEREAAGGGTNTAHLQNSCLLMMGEELDHRISNVTKYEEGCKL